MIFVVTDTFIKMFNPKDIFRKLYFAYTSFKYAELNLLNMIFEDMLSCGLCLILYISIFLTFCQSKILSVNRLVIMLNYMKITHIVNSLKEVHL